MTPVGLEYQGSDGDVAHFWFGWGVGHYGAGEGHYSGLIGQVAKYTAASTNAWKRYDGWNDAWYGTNHPGVSTPGEPPFCD